MFRCLKQSQAASQAASTTDLFRRLERSQATSQTTFQAASNTSLDQRLELFERRIMTTLTMKMMEDVMNMAIPRVNQAVDEAVNKHITTIAHKHLEETLDRFIDKKLEDSIWDSVCTDKGVIATEL